MATTACTITHVEPEHNPNEGRVIINENFDCLDFRLTSAVIASATGASAVAAGVNIDVPAPFYSAGQLTYIVNVVDDPVFTSVSAGTMYSNSLLYTNSASTPTTIGGITAASTFSSKTMQEMWTMLLYPFQVPAFTAFARTNLSTTYELGETVLVGSQTFTWTTSNSSNVSANTVTITQNVPAPSTTIYGPGANVGTSAITLSSIYSAGTSSAVTLYTIVAYNVSGNSFSSTISRNWRPRVYYGTSGATTLVEAGVKALASSTLTNTFAGTFSFAAGGYKYFCYPTTFGTATSFKDSLTLLDVAMESPYVLSITNAYGVTGNYNVHRTTNILGSTIDIIIS